MKCCIYTVLVGGYEHLNEQPVASRSQLPFIFLTDDPALRSESWDCRVIEPLFQQDPIRSQRELKIRRMSTWLITTAPSTSTTR